jgi:hypothetical protein
MRDFFSLDVVPGSGGSAGIFLQHAAGMRDSVTYAGEVVATLGSVFQTKFSNATQREARRAKEKLSNAVNEVGRIHLPSDSRVRVRCLQPPWGF